MLIGKGIGHREIQLAADSGQKKILFAESLLHAASCLLRADRTG
jgi:hypothetical protein